MDAERTILDIFGVDLSFLTQVVVANPSLRDVIIGYLAERKLWDQLATDPRITAIRKDDDHDRDNKGDLVVTYLGHEFRIEVKSLQTNSIRMLDPGSGVWLPKVVAQPSPDAMGKRRRKKWIESEAYRTLWLSGGGAARFTGKVQCDASDRREVVLPSGRRVTTTNLVAGEFDVLALGLFAFRERWDFAFVLNRDLPRSTHREYAEEDRQHLLKTLIPVEWPLLPGHTADPFTLLDRLVAERQQTTPASGTSETR